MQKTALINGSPSLFITPSEIPNLPKSYISDFVSVACDMVREASVIQEKTDNEDRLNDPGLNAWYEERDAEFWNDPKAVAEYDAWVSEQERIHLEMTPEEETYLCSRYDADAAELESLGCGGRHAIAGHDKVWQAGGAHIVQRPKQGMRPVYYRCPKCGLQKHADITEEVYGEFCYLFCNDCGEKVEKVESPPALLECPHPRVIDLTEPMPCIISVKVTDEMIENGEIPF